jgi:hypothetical protein
MGTIEAAGDLGARIVVCETLFQLGLLAESQGQNQRAVKLLGASEFIREELGVDLDPEVCPEFEQFTEALSNKLEPREFEAAWAAGRAMDFDVAMDYAVQG